MRIVMSLILAGFLATAPAAFAQSSPYCGADSPFGSCFGDAPAQPNTSEDARRAREQAELDLYLAERRAQEARAASEERERRRQWREAEDRQEDYIDSADSDEDECARAFGADLGNILMGNPTSHSSSRC